MSTSIDKIVYDTAEKYHKYQNKYNYERTYFKDYQANALKVAQEKDKAKQLEKSSNHTKPKTKKFQTLEDKWDQEIDLEKQRNDKKIVSAWKIIPANVSAFSDEVLEDNELIKKTWVKLEFLINKLQKCNSEVIDRSINQDLSIDQKVAFTTVDSHNTFKTTNESFNKESSWK